MPAFPPGPRTAQKPHALTLHGETRDDPYYWLRDPDWQAVMRDPSRLDPGIRAHLEAENAHADAVLAPTAALQARLEAEMRGRIKEEDESVPAPDGAFAYFTRYREGGQYPLLCRLPRAGGPSETLFDGDREAEGKAYFQLGGFFHSDDHRLLAYSLDCAGSEFFEIRVRDVAAARDLGDLVPDTAGGLAWAPDGRSFLYVRLDETHRPRWVCRHRLGTPASEDAIVYEETDPAFFLGLGRTESRAFFVIEAAAKETTEVYLLPTDDADAAPRLIAPRLEGRQYDVAHRGDRLFILTNADGAVDFKIVTAPLEAPGPGSWTDLVPHVPGRLILSQTLFEEFHVRLEREGGLPRIVVTALTPEGGIGESHAIAFDEEAYALGMDGGYEFAARTLRFSYSSPTTPRETYDYDMASRARTLRKRQEVPSGHNPSDYVTRRLRIPSHDGTPVPVTLLHHKDTPLDGSAPVLLYGYGAYGITIPAGFGTQRLSLVDRGFIYAIAHVRGGTDLGYGWYTDGKLAAKANSFADFIAVGRGLVAAGLTREGRIIAHGGSAGGLLVGAAMNRDPALFLGVIAEVPFVDVLTTICDESLPLTPPEWTEWGDPIRDRTAFDRLASYSPYDNIRPQAYPHVLATAGLTDPRVTYWEPAKWVARLRATRTDEGLTLLKTYMGAGHAGASGRFDQLKEDAYVQAFALMIAGLV
ncbi:MAG: S9 family peptidase [Alphaproteobacteria bacterium]|nr:S9 family peptidase [Alphaproteobacteria bacterium]